LACVAIVTAVLLPAAPAQAHPLGNFSVIQQDAFDLYPDRIDVTATVDIAELPTLQDRDAVDSDGDGTASDAERLAYARTTCHALASDLAVSVSGRRLAWTVSGPTFEYVAGSAGLSTSRLGCELSSPASLRTASTVDIHNQFRSDRIGWREMTAVGHHVRLVNSPLPETSISDNLRAYPTDLLASPLNVRSARLSVEPGDGRSTVAAGARGPQSTSPGLFARWTARAEGTLQGLIGGRHMTPLVGVLAVLLALLLGAGHAALPGHGKTVMAVYLTSRAGRVRDALGVAATVTLTHTGGVLVLGLLLTTVTSLAGEQLLAWLGVLSGLTVAAVGAGMLRGAGRRKHGHRGQHAHAHEQGHRHEHGHEHDHGYPHDHDHPHEHDHPYAHDHGAPGRLSIVGMGVAGGLVPSPSALIVLLAAIGLGRTGFGILLVVAYGFGMAATLTAAGFALVLLRRRWAGRFPRAGGRWARIARFTPVGTAMLVLLVGVGLAGRALAGVA
jgi:ABC-type nickel/cobalt efflux system permease component RcnA